MIFGFLAPNVLETVVQDSERRHLDGPSKAKRLQAVAPTYLLLNICLSNMTGFRPNPVETLSASSPLYAEVDRW